MKALLASMQPLFTKPREIEIWERMPGNSWVSVGKELIEG